MTFSARQALALIGLLCVSCLNTEPDLPDRRLLTGSTWIPGRSRTSLSSGGQPLEIHNTGEGTLLLEHDGQLIQLEPGDIHSTLGSDVLLRNDLQGEGQVRLIHPGGLPGQSPAAIQLLRNGEVQRVQAVQRTGGQQGGAGGSKSGGAVRVPAVNR